MIKCPAAEEWLMYQQGEGSAVERQEQQAHLAQCAACRERLHTLGFLLHATAALSPTEGAPAAPDCPAPEALRAYVERRLPKSPRAAIRSHLQTCAACLSQAADLSAAQGYSSDARRLRPPGWLRARLGTWLAPTAPGEPRRIRWTLPQLGLSYAAVAAVVAGLVLLLHRPAAPPGTVLGPGQVHPGRTYQGDGAALWEEVRGQAAALRAADLEERAEKAPTEAERLFYFSLLLEHYEQTGQSERASALRTRLREGLE